MVVVGLGVNLCRLSTTRIFQSDAYAIVFGRNDFKMMRLRLNGATVLDVGANKGIYCYWMMRAVGRSGRVLAFEPQPEMRDDIEKHTKRLSWLNLKVINGALSNFDGVTRLSRQKIGDGSATLEDSRHRDEDELIEVPVMKLDSLPAEMFTNLKFIKCDVEGHELNVFLGGEQTIRLHRPVVQFGEYGHRRTNDVFRFFRDLGYLGVHFLGNAYLHYSDLTSIPHYKFGFGGHRDFLFFHQKRLERRSRSICRSNFRKPLSFFKGKQLNG